MTNNSDLIELEVKGLGSIGKISRLKRLLSGDKSKYYLILTKKDDPNVTVAMGVGEFEGQAIAVAFEKMTPSRPLTHDLFKSATEGFGFQLVLVLINKLDENGYFHSLLKYTNGQKVIDIDSRPADAIALALRHNSPIFIDKNLHYRYLNIPTK